VGVGKGVFEGRTTSLSVQHFGLPLSAYPAPHELLESKIETNQIQLEALKETLNRLENEIRTIRSKRKEYNDLVSKYNELLEETKKLVNQYNVQAKLFNECVSTAG